MKSKLAAIALSVVALFVLLGANAKKETKPTFTKPELKIDKAPLSEGKAPVLTSYADVLEGIRPAVVSVYSSKIVRQQVPEFFRQLYGNNIRGKEEKQEGLGSGVIISADGFILTNNHVVEDADELKVQLNDERELTATLVGRDPKTDIAIIKIDATKLPYATLGDSDKIRVGDVVFAIGNPLAVGQTVTMGIISATGRHVGILEEVGGYEDFIQTDASINRGNSGGALVDAKGRLIGINSAIISNTQGSIGIGFAIPINLAQNIMNSLIETGSVSRGYLGVSGDALSAETAEAYGLPRETKGVLISDVTPSSAAAKAGLKREDIITSINEKAVITKEDLRMIIAQSAPGTTVTVKFLRENKPQSAQVTLGKLEDAMEVSGEWLPGINTTPLTDDLRRELRIAGEAQGLVISEVSPDSPYAEIFPTGALIEQVNRAPVADLASAKGALVSGARNRAIIYFHGVRRIVSFMAP